MHPKRRKWYLVLGLLISGVFLGIALDGLDLSRVWSHMQGARWGWLAPALVAYFVTVAGRAWRWRYLLRPLSPVAISHLYGALIIGYFGNNVYPFRIGELLRVYVLNRRAGTPLSAGLATLLVERVFDGLTVLLFVFASLPLAPLPGDDVRLLVTGASVLFIGALLLFLLLALRPAQATQWVERLSRPLLPAPFSQRITAASSRFLRGFATLKRPRHHFWLLLGSLLIWLGETAKYWLVMRAFPFQIPFWGLLLMIGIVNLATILPSAPGFIGTFDLPAIAVLVLFGVEETAATAYVLVLHAVLWAPSAFFGLAYMTYAGWRWSDLDRAATAAQQRSDSAPSQ